MKHPPLSHYCAEPLGELRPIVQVRPPHMSFSFKPRGLWLSVDGEDDWAAWCRGEGYGLDRLALRYSIVLKAPERVLWLNTAPAVLEFQERYGVSDGVTRYPAIDWERGGAEHAGLVIAPYQWSLRMGLMWYYGWDCASGCIWDTSVIERVTLEPRA